MSTLTASVGSGGTNRPNDVFFVQRLLNENGSTPKLRVDGLNGRRTIAAIKVFQSRIVGLRNPDGRVDPGGRTIAKLRAREGRKPEASAPKRNASDPGERREFRKDRRNYVDPRVKETGVTSRIIDALYPRFRGSNIKIISGWLSDSDLFWKVDYHWEYLLWMVDHCRQLQTSKDGTQKLNGIRSALLGVAPRPDHGYRTSAAVGKPADQSTADEMTRRHKILSQQKREFRAVTRKEDLIAKSTKPASAFHLAAAPVAHPGTSKHSSGYALDIKGPAGTVKSICKSMGASLVFDEKSHIHVEFKNGVSG